MASSSNIPEVKYDVFLSFRGEDTRNNFTSHLDAAFRHKGIRAFIDYELDRGDEISPSLLKAIEHSKISVIILSENYASSRWCLEELAKILDCKKRFGQMVIPIFHHVDPSNVRNQTGAFGEAFNELKKRFEGRFDVQQRSIFGLFLLFYPKNENDVLQRWETALVEVGKLSGITTDSKPESVLIEEIVMDILKRLNKMSPSDHSHLVGVESAIKEIEFLLKIGSNDVCIVGIWGLGGIGKTSISRAIFNKYLNYFEGSFFAENVREESNNCKRLTALHQELLCIILEDRYANLGLTHTKERLTRKKVLIVFDDVTSLNQIENLIGDPKCLGLGSRIIITSRDKQVLTNCGADKIYKLKELVDYEAYQLFNRFAFRHDGYTIKEYKELSKRIITYAKGVPLALKVLGSSLSRKTKQEWESAVNKLERTPPKDIQDVLKISFDGLDYEEKQLFLDIACIFKGDDRNLVISVMDSCGYSTEIGLSVLIDMSLVIVSNDKITMHDLLEQMGKEIVRQESIEDPGKRSYLFHPEDICHVLTRNKGTTTIKGICLDVSRVEEIQLTRDAFSKMSNLKYFKVYGEDFNKLYGFQDVESVFAELKYLFWHRYPCTSLPPKFHPENLVAIEMPESNIEQLWPGVQNIVNIKHINLSQSKHLLKCPDLSLAKNLETLNLECCTNLIEIHSSIQYLDKLSMLNLRRCTSLCSIPSGICSKSLRSVDFGGCSNLDTVPSISCNVLVLSLYGTAIRELPSSIESLSKLEKLILDDCTRLESLPSGICKLKSLARLTLSSCSKLNSLPDEIGNLEALRLLAAGGTGIREFSPSIKCFKELEELNLAGNNIKEYVGLLLSDLSGLQLLKHLNLSNCCITELPSSLGQLTSLEGLYIHDNKFESIPESIINLSKLSQLDVCGCDVVKSLPVLPSSIKYLKADDCYSLELLSGLSISWSTAWGLKTVNFSNCLKLALEDIVEYPLQNIQPSATIFTVRESRGKLHNPNCYICLSGSCYICLSGSSIPEWLTFRSTGSFIKLLPGCLNGDLVGLLFCIVVSPRDHHDEVEDFKVIYELHLKSDGGQYAKKAEGSCSIFATLDSDHIILSCEASWSAQFCFNDEVLFQFYIQHWKPRPLEYYEVKECGVTVLLYPQTSGAAMKGFVTSISCEENKEDQQYANRQKLA